MSAEAIWLAVCVFLVLLQQVGFLLLESGLVRSKNNVNVAAKNVLDLCLVILLFWFIGQEIVFDGDLVLEGEGYLVFLYQSLFCATCVTLISGAISERVGLWVYVMVAVLTAVFIYPFFAFNVWSQAGLLAQFGFIDLAGSAVVHVVGGVIALAVLLIIGPREGVFDKGRKVALASNMPVAVGGGFLLFIGWLGFNGGSAYRSDIDVFLVIINTVFAACGAGAFAVVFSLLRRSIIDVKVLINAILSGLVASCASAHLITPSQALMLGVLAYWVMKGFSSLLEYFEVDDAVDAVPVHLGGGVVGVLLPVLFVSEFSLFPQLAGLAVAVVWGFGLTYAVMRLINRFWPLRISKEAEKLGLNIYEHGERNELSDMIGSIKHNHESGNLTKRLPENDATEVGLLAGHYNGLLTSIDAQQRELQDLLRESRRLQGVKDEFIATMNHEIRTPITAVIGFAKRLVSGVSNADESRDLSQRVLEAGQRLDALSKQLLDVERIDGFEHGVSCQAYSCEAVVREVGVQAHLMFDELGVGVKESFSKGLEGQVYIDMQVLYDVLREVFDNARKFGDGVSIDINYNFDQRKSFVCSITNYGSQLLLAHEPYEKFWQADSSLSRSHEGLGLGLYLSRQLLGAMGCSICHESSSNSVTFFLSFPLLADDNESEEILECMPEGSQNELANAHVVSYKGKRCLIVDDTMDNQVLIEFAMTDLGFDCDTAENGGIAVEKVRAEQYDIVMMDMQMPVMDGVTATQKIREELGITASELPIVAITANDLEEHRQQCFAAGMNDFLTKPLDNEKLKAVLLNLLVDQ